MSVIFSSVCTFIYKIVVVVFLTCKSFSSPDLPQVFKSMADHSSIRLSFCSLPAKIPLVTLLAGLLLFLFDGLQGAFGGYVYTYAVKRFKATGVKTERIKQNSGKKNK